MTTKKKTDKNKTAKKESAKDSGSEMNAPRWSIVSFEKRVAENLIYAEAVKKLEQLSEQKISGLCIVTNEAAARITKQD